MKTLSPTDSKNHKNKSSLEIELLLCCARTHIDASTGDRIKNLVQQNIDWEYLISTAYRHGVDSLLYYSLNQTCPDAVPETILIALQKNFQSNAISNLFLTNQLLKILDFLAENQISAIPFKGPVLGALVYGNLAFRKFCDLDIIVHKQDILKVKHLLISQGFQPVPNLTSPQEEIYIESQLGYNFVRNDGIVVEVHWTPIPKMFTFPIDTKQLWENLQVITVAGKSVPIVAPEDFLIILCAHGCKDRWSQLKWVCDIAELIRTRQELDWERILEQAKILGSKRRLGLGLLLAHNLLGIKLPEKVLQDIHSSSITPSLATQVEQWIFYKNQAEFYFMERTYFHLQAREKIVDKILFYFHYLTTPIRTEDWQLAEDIKLLFLPQVLRHPFRLLGEFMNRYVVNRLNFSWK
jgi:Uncharacterised nucleotidyltransferase